MSITSLSIVSALRTSMQWHGARQKVLAENVANADTPGFKPKELVRPDLRPGRASGAAGVALDRTDAVHLAGLGSDDGSETATKQATDFETRPSGNAVSLEDEMVKVADNQAEYQLAASLYQKSLALLRTAAGSRGA